MELLSTSSFKQSLSICGGLILYLSVCGHICLWSETNQETSSIVQHLIHQVTPINVWWSDSFSFSIWTHLSLDRNKSRNNWKSWALHPSTVNCQYVVVWLFLFKYVWMRNPVKELNQETTGTLEYQFLQTSSKYPCTFQFYLWQMPL